MNNNEKIICYTLIILIISMFIVMALLYIYIERVEEMNGAIGHLEQIVIDIRDNKE